ncbi:DUF4276 family protein [Aquisalinus flavus]|uniref:DUF4276 family protein n=1 Tax=Aquisalinus flavus TaxID=1526572 RepID=A0A8J2Y588_9PROT|nr:DUF4276 family protein [Aquisalinus flavus]MBD0426159.1 DUF4276 family protein [Aquisalinus flavus]UNE48263.1 DUF4276 family protein [Aquisalinus flavus]GGD10122.1 hypothetical protein GCM10011342_18800 [Aquisalinus flavus]
MSYPEVVVLTEEPSIKEVILKIWGKVPDSSEVSLKCIVHEGASDLERSIPRKLKGWQNPHARFLILRDNDTADCMVRKNKILALCEAANKHEHCKVRIVCQELESWFLGDLKAVEDANLADKAISHKQRHMPYREPDTIQSPIPKLDALLKKEIIVSNQKITIARTIAPHIDVERNLSPSFQNTFSALCRLAGESLQSFSA